MLKVFDDDQYVDICIGLDNFIVPKTIYFGRAKILLEAKSVLERFDKFPVKNVTSYEDISESKMVIMITLKEN